MTATIPRPGPAGPQGPAGPTGPAGSGGIDEYTHVQNAPVSDWTVDHMLGRRPAGLTVWDSSNTEVEGAVEYVNDDQIILHFSAPFSGRAVLV